LRRCRPPEPLPGVDPSHEAWSRTGVGSTDGDRRPALVATTLVAVLILLAMTPTGCGGTDSADDARTTVSFVTWKPNQPGVWDEIYDRFEREYPELVLEREVGPHSSTAFHDMLTQKLKNRSTDVDVFLMDVIWPAEFAAAGWAASLDDRFHEVERGEFFDGAVAAASVQDGIYAVPLYLAGGMLYYRTDLLEEYGFEPPRTWPELVSQATIIVEGERAEAGEVSGGGGEVSGGGGEVSGTDGEVSGGGGEVSGTDGDVSPGNRLLTGYSGQFKQYEGLICNMLELVRSNGGRLLGEGDDASAIAAPAAVQAVRFARQELIGPVAPRGVLTYEEPESLAPFVQGNAVFHRNWPYAWQVANDPEQSRVAGDVGIAPLPRFGGGQSVSTLGGWMVGVSALSEHKEAAWTFVEFLTSPEIQKLLAVEGGLAPTREALYEDAEVLAAQPQLERMRDVFRAAVPRPRTPLYPAVSNALQRYFSRMISSDEADVEAAARRAASEIEELLEMAR